MENWTYILTWGTDLDLYGREDERKVVDRKTGDVLFQYNRSGKNLRQVITEYETDERHFIGKRNG